MALSIHNFHLDFAVHPHQPHPSTLPITRVTQHQTQPHTKGLFWVRKGPLGRSLPAGVSAVVAFPLSEVRVFVVEGHRPEKAGAAVPEPEQGSAFLRLTQGPAFGNMLLQGPCTATWVSFALNAAQASPEHGVSLKGCKL
jgi:hypothetical protein